MRVFEVDEELLVAAPVAGAIGDRAGAGAEPPEIALTDAAAAVAPATKLSAATTVTTFSVCSWATS